MAQESTVNMQLTAFLRENHNFPGSRQVEGRTSIADIYAKKKRCGLYVLTFSNGDIYAGQAIDVTRRFVQHNKNHEDIAHINFKCVAKTKLDEEERSLIWALKKNGFSLRNITFTSIPKGVSDFELLMPESEQNRWLTDSGKPVLEGTRVQDEILRRKYEKRFEKYQKKPYADEFIGFLSRYAILGLPVPLKSELAFWSVTCLPSTDSGADVSVYLRVNVNWQEVLSLYTFEDHLCFSFYVALSPLQEAYGDSLMLLEEKHPELYIGDNFYEPGGQDQINIVIAGLRNAYHALDDLAIQSSIRLFNLRLMKTGPCAFSRYHCLDLADRVFANLQKPSSCCR